MSIAIQFCTFYTFPIHFPIPYLICSEMINIVYLTGMDGCLIVFMDMGYNAETLQCAFIHKYMFLFCHVIPVSTLFFVTAYIKFIYSIKNTIIAGNVSCQTTKILIGQPNFEQSACVRLRSFFSWVNRCGLTHTNAYYVLVLCALGVIRSWLL